MSIFIAATRGSETDLASVAAKVTALQETVAKKNRELDTHARHSQHLRQLFANHLMRAHIRGHKQKRILMNLHLGAMEMQESLECEEQRRTAGDAAVVSATRTDTSSTLTPSHLCLTSHLLLSCQPQLRR